MLKNTGFAIGCLLSLAVAYLFIPPPQHARAQFSEQLTYGGTSTGLANAQAISIPNITAPPFGVPLRFIPGFTNTGPTQINVSGLGLVNVVRPSSIGNVALSGGELQAGELTCVTYIGASYQLTCNVDLTPIGRTVEFRGSATPRGTLIEDGSCVSRTTYAPLFLVIGTTYGACDGSTTFALPDSRGTSFMALDGQGSNGNAGRITTSSCGTPNAVTLCGSDTRAIGTTNLPASTLGVSVSGNVSVTGSGTPTVTVTGSGTVSTTSTRSDVLFGSSVSAASGGSFTGGQLSANGALTATGTTSVITSTGTLPINLTSTGSNSMTGSTSNMGSGTPYIVLNPTLLGRRAIKY